MSCTSESRGLAHRIRTVALYLAVITVFATSLGCQSSVAQPAAPQQRGFALPTWEVTGYDGPGVEQSLREIRALGANWVQFTPTWYQQTTTSSHIYRTEKTVSDSGQERAITLAHQLGLKVLLKPHLNLTPQGSNRIAAQDAIIQAQNSQVQRLAAVTKALGEAQEENQVLRDQKASLETSNQELSDQVLRLNNTIAAYEAAAAAKAEADAQASAKKGKS